MRGGKASYNNGIAASEIVVRTDKSSIEFTLSANSGYSLELISVEGGNVETTYSELINNKRTLTVSNLLNNKVYNIVVTLSTSKPNYSISFNLTNVEALNLKIEDTLNNASTIEAGLLYEVDLAPITGYTINNILVKIGDNTYSLDSTHIEVIANGNILITATATEGITHKVNRRIPNATLSSSVSNIPDGESYETSIIADEGYTLRNVNVMMGNSPVLVEGNTITIPSVSDDVTITGVTTKDIVATNTAVILVNPEYFADKINEAITIGLLWSHTFEIPKYQEGYNLVPAYEYVSHNLTMEGGGTITRDGNRFYTDNVTGNITGTITYKLVDNVKYGHINIGVYEGEGRDDNSLREEGYHSSSFKITGKQGNSATVTTINNGWTLKNSFILASRNPHFENGVYTRTSGDTVSEQCVANNLSWNPNTGVLTVTKPFFLTRDSNGLEQECYMMIVLLPDALNHPADFKMKGYIEFTMPVGSTNHYHITSDGTVTSIEDWSNPTYEVLSLSDGDFDVFGWCRPASFAYGETYRQTGSRYYHLIPDTGYILDHITVLDKRDGTEVNHNFTRGNLVTQNVLTVSNVKVPLLITSHCIPDPNITTAKFRLKDGTRHSENITIGDDWVHEFDDTVASMDIWMYGDTGNSTILFSDNTIEILNVTGNIRANITYA